MNGFMEFLRTSFWHVAPVLACGAVALAITIERVNALYALYPLRNKQSFFDKLTELVIRGQIAEAIAFCDRFQGKLVAKIAKAALLRAHQPENLVIHGLELAVGDATQAIQKRTSFLATIANVATLLGLFGTISGLIHSFEAVAHADAQQKSALLAAGISTAMNATMLGLAVAIPCMVIFSFLMNKQNRMVADVDHTAVAVLDLLKQRFYAVDQGEVDVAGLNDEIEKADGKAERNGSGRAQLRRVA